MPMAMEESELKDILLSLVESNRNKQTDHIPADVKGWRFPSSSSSSSEGAAVNVERPAGGGGAVDDDQYDHPACFWTGVTCDAVDGSITGLNLGESFYARTLLGIGGPGDEGAGRRSSRALLRRYDDDEGVEVALRKERRVDEIEEGRTKRRRAAADDATDGDVGPAFPSSIGRLTTLRFLDMSSNLLRGTIPRSVLGLPQLEVFHASSNDLEGTFPHFESDALRVLDLSRNRFHGRLGGDLFGHPDVGPNTAPYLMSLVKFDISHNGFNGTIPLDGTSGFYNRDIGHDESLQNLKYLDLGYNLFSGTIPNNLANFENMQGLFLEHNRLVGTIPKSIYRGSGQGARPLPLVQIFLEQNSLSGTLNGGLATLPNLLELYVDGNKFTGVVPPELCEAHLNHAFLQNSIAARDCDGISCPANSASREGVAPCVPCLDDGGYHRYLGQHWAECRSNMEEVDILDLFYERMHGDEWLDHSYSWEKGAPVCQRKGVACDDAGRVTEIRLPSLGLRGPIPSKMGWLSQLRVLDLSGNDLTGLLPSDLRFLPLTLLDIRGSQMRGVVPPLLCVKEGINGNGIGPPGTDNKILYACENIVCPRGTYSSIGRASVPENEGEDGVRCLPCYDDQASFYMGRDRCTDVSIAGIVQIRSDVFRRGLAKSIPVMVAAAFLAVLARALVRRRKSSDSAFSTDENTDDAEHEDAEHDDGDPILAEHDDAEHYNVGHDDGEPILPRLSSISLRPLQQLWTSSHEDDEGEVHSEGDWTAGYSESRGTRPVKKVVELPETKSSLPNLT